MPVDPLEEARERLEADRRWLASRREAGHCGEGTLERKQREAWNDRIDRLLAELDRRSPPTREGGGLGEDALTEALAWLDGPDIHEMYCAEWWAEWPEEDSEGVDDENQPVVLRRGKAYYRERAKRLLTLLAAAPPPPTDKPE